MINWLKELFRHRTAVLVYSDGHEEVKHVTVRGDTYWVIDRDGNHCELLKNGGMFLSDLPNLCGSHQLKGWFKHKGWTGEEFKE
jgi:hypothetical protein